MRKRTMIPLGITFLIALVTAPARAQPRPTLQLQIPQRPQPVLIDGGSMVYYELRLANPSPDTVQITRVTARISRVQTVTLAGEELKSKITAVTLPPAASAIVYLEIPIVYLEIPIGRDKTIEHEIAYTSVKGDTRMSSIYRHAPVRTARDVPPVLGAPLHDGAWAAIYDAAWPRGHRRVVFTVKGVDYIPGRFAIDFVRLDDQWRYAGGNKDSIKQWHGYANPVYAVANGVVVATRTDFSESPTISGHHAHASAYTAADGTGNYVAIDIGHDHVVFYEHLRHGSILVTPGQKVTEGQPIGAVGFTGHSTGPHLHLHVATRNASLGAEGIPFVFRSFKKIGAYPDLSHFGEMPGSVLALPVNVTEERPGPNTVITFAR